MDFKLARVAKEAGKNAYDGIGALNGTIVFLWTLLCLLIISIITNSLFALALAAVFYASVLLLCRVLFKDISRYMKFPGNNSKMPVFIGHKLDILFIYPLFLMVLIGLIGRVITATGLIPASPQQIHGADAGFLESAARVILIPLVAYTEELLNLLMISFFYKSMKPLGSQRFAASMLCAALTFGILHSFSWGMNTALLIGISYIPVFFITLYTGSIWISFLAHLYNDMISLAKAYNEGYHLIIIIAVSIIPAIWALRAMFRKTS